MKKLDFSDGKITGGWDFVKSYGSEVDFCEGDKGAGFKEDKDGVRQGIVG